MIAGINGRSSKAATPRHADQGLSPCVANRFSLWHLSARHYTCQNPPLDPGKEPELQTQTLRDIEAVRRMLAEIHQQTGQEA